MAHNMYTYTPLASTGPQSIRLLRILSAPGQATKCSIQSFPITKAPPYDCLSYTWGGAIDHSFSASAAKSWRPMTGDRNMLITHSTAEGAETLIRVTENLLDALYEMSKHGYSCEQRNGSGAATSTGPHGLAKAQSEVARETLQPEPTRSRNSEYLWIDAICNNQDPDSDDARKEKEDQVAMMGSIYDHAQKVIIWLGKDDQHSGDAFEVMERLEACEQDPDNPINDPHAQKPSFAVDGVDIHAALHDICQFLGIGADPIQYYAWTSYAAFLCRGWFGRAWVLQERFFAKQTVVLCGEHLVDWALVARCASVLARTNANILLQRLVLRLRDDPAHEYESGTRLSDTRINNQSFFGVIHKDNAASLRLEDLLYYSRFLNATEPKDHVYALLWIWYEAQVQRGASAEAVVRITPRYSSRVPFADVHMEATMAAIRESGHLNIMSLVQNVAGPAGWPSWVPNYAQRVRTQCLLKWRHDNVDQARPWAAGQGLTCSEPMLQHGPSSHAGQDHVEVTLAVSGQYIGSVAAIGPTHAEIDFECKLIKLLMLIPHYIEDKPASHYRHPHEAFWRTIIADTFRNRQPAEDAARTAFPLFMAWRLIELEGHIQSTIGQANDPALVKDLRKLQEDALSTLDRLSTEHRDRKKDDHTWTEVFRNASETKQLQEMLRKGSDESEGQNRYWYELMRDFEFSFWAACSGRKVFATTDGYFGVTGDAVEVGDEVWILAGASTPFVLSKRGGSSDRRSVVAESYVHGIMYGEAVVNDPQQILLV